MNLCFGQLPELNEALARAFLSSLSCLSVRLQAIVAQVGLGAAPGVQVQARTRVI